MSNLQDNIQGNLQSNLQSKLPPYNKLNNGDELDMDPFSCNTGHCDWKSLAGNWVMKQPWWVFLTALCILGVLMFLCIYFVFPDTSPDIDSVYIARNVIGTLCMLALIVLIPVTGGLWVARYVMGAGMMNKKGEIVNSPLVD